MKITQNKVAFLMIVLGMSGSVIGIFGGMLLQSVSFMLAGLLTWGICLIVIISMAAYNYLIK